MYPQIAQTAKVQGIVIIEAIIGKDGSVKDAKVLRSVALLDQAALDAVRQWKFTPTLLNGVAGRGHHDRHRELHAAIRWDARGAASFDWQIKSRAAARARARQDSFIRSDVIATRLGFGGWNGRMDLMHMWEQMGWVAKVVAFVLVFMSMWSFGVAIERYYTFSQARKQSKLYAPQVAKHLKEGRLKDALTRLAGQDVPVQPPGQGRAGRVCRNTSSSTTPAARSIATTWSTPCAAPSSAPRR